MPTLEVPGATLYYETTGSGPLMLLIPGAQGHGRIFSDVAGYLGTHYTVACIDRRGFSRSILTGTQQYAERLATDADDAYAVIKHLSKDPAVVLGSSSGAIVAMNLLIRHPESVKTVVAHEPPSLSILPEEFQPKAMGLIQQIYDTYRAHGAAAGAELFVTNLLPDPQDSELVRSSLDVSHSDENRANTLYWFEFELRQYTASPLDLDKIKANEEKFIPAAGSGKGQAFGPIATIAAGIGRYPVILPGAHLGFQTVPKEFSEALLEVLK